MIMAMDHFARFDESVLEPGTFEIISYMSDGTMFHADRTGERLSINVSQIMVMNAGKGFWHEESTPADGETAKMMQIIVPSHDRSRTLDPAHGYRRSHTSHLALSRRA
jgi:Pirin-related protein